MINTENNGPLLPQLDEFLETTRQKRGLPSLNAAAALGSDVFWRKACGFATLDPARPAHPDIVYPLGSITKVFVVTMLMQLVERGVVALEDPITKYIPEYKVTSPFPGGRGTSFRPQPAAPANLRQLAAHTAGLPRDAAINFPMNQSLGDWEFSDGQASLRFAADLSAGQPGWRDALCPAGAGPVWTAWRHFPGGYLRRSGRK